MDNTVKYFALPGTLEILDNIGKYLAILIHQLIILGHKRQHLTKLVSTNFKNGQYLATKVMFVERQWADQIKIILSDNNIGCSYQYWHILVVTEQYLAILDNVHQYLKALKTIITH